MSAKAIEEVTHHPLSVEKTRIKEKKRNTMPFGVNEGKLMVILASFWAKPIYRGGREGGQCSQLTVQ